MNKKYELIDETVEIDDDCVIWMNYAGTILHRIKAVRDFGDVHAGDLGGFIEDETNLSHEGNCWVYDDVQVFGGARVKDNAQVHDNAVIFKDANVSGNARIYGEAFIYGER